VWAEPEVPTESNQGNLAQSVPQEFPKVRRAELDSLRELHDGALFVLQRYATLEAVVTALERERQENQAFLIGASSLIPGVGQMINGDYLQGGLLLFADGMSGATVNQLAYTRRPNRRQETPMYFLTETVQNGLMVYATLHAANASYREHHDRTAAMWTGLASVVPGAGQAINGNWWEAGGLFAGWVATSWLMTALENATPAESATTVKAPEAPNQTHWALALLPGGAYLNVNYEW
jgi:hypothetical protein